MFLALIVFAPISPRTAYGIDLRWSTGSSSLEFAAMTRCTLVVLATAGEDSLPPQWTLVWAADSCSVQPIAIVAPPACAPDTAKTSSVEMAAGPAGLLANVLEAEFCSAASEAAAIATYVLDLPASGRGKFQIAALDPTDPAGLRVFRSPVATFNGGVDPPFPPVVLRAGTFHESTELVLDAVGLGLGQVVQLELVATDGSWNLPLEITAQTDSTISGTASLAAAVPECVVKATTDSGRVGMATLPAEIPPSLAVVDPQGQSCQETFKEHIYDYEMPDLIQPKDFAFVLGGWTPSGSWTFHLFYIRQNQETKRWHGGVDATEKNIGHAVSNDLNTWAVLDTAAIAVRPGRFDSQHVWAPCIVLRGLTYYMFYTGADESGDQRMGLATSTDLMTWTQQDDPVFDFSSLGPWASPEVEGPPYFGAAQFRDPWVMPDPANPGQWLMYFVTVPDDYRDATVVGVAESEGDFTQWENDRPIFATLHPTPSPGQALVESPSVFASQGKWWLFYTANMTTVYGISNPTSPTDETAANWSAAASINALVVDEISGQPTNSYTYWHATEYLSVSPTRDLAFLAAWNDLAVGISYIPVRTAVAPPLFYEHCPVNAAGVGEPVHDERGVELLRLGGPGGRIGLRVVLSRAMAIRLVVYDVSGRHLKTLVEGELPAGVSDLHWNGRDEDGADVGSGIYFARIEAEDSARSVPVPLVR
jgi:hypothetical protein